MKISLIALTALVMASASFDASAQSSVAPSFKLPFGCGESWIGETYRDVAPAYGIEFRRDARLESFVRAAATGSVVGMYNVGPNSDRSVTLDHGNGWRTTYTNFESLMPLRKGERVQMGQQLGMAGRIDRTTTYMHFQLTHQERPVRASFERVMAQYWGSRNYVGTHGCGTGPLTGTARVAPSVHVEPDPKSPVREIWLQPGSRVKVECQRPGGIARYQIPGGVSSVGFSEAWYKVGGLGYIPDFQIDTQGRTPALCR